MNDDPQEFLDYLHSITAKRPRTVIEHILRHGHITSEELKEIYGYNHPPRAIRDVRELNIPIVTYRIRGKDGRSIAAYKLGTPGSAADTLSKSSGRTALSKSLKKALINKYGSKCFIYLETMDESFLQVDHRIPYEIGGEQDERDVDCYMLLSPSANRANRGHVSTAQTGKKRMRTSAFTASGRIPKTMNMLQAGKNVWLHWYSLETKSMIMKSWSSCQEKTLLRRLSNGFFTSI